MKDNAVSTRPQTCVIQLAIGNDIFRIITEQKRLAGPSDECPVDNWDIDANPNRNHVLTASLDHHF